MAKAAPAPAKTGELQQPSGPSRDLVMKTRDELDRMTSQFAPLLPAHIPADRFARVVMNALQREPKLYAVDRRTLWNACMQSAEDGLLPDGREGAIVPFKNAKAGRTEAVWIPMVRGVRKLVRNSGLIADLNVQVVQAGDAFDFELGDNPFIRHKPVGGSRTRPVLWAYSIARYKDGTMSRDVMHIDAIMEVARKSRAFESGPWSDKVFLPEMCAKTVTKHHFKQLPTDRDLDRVLRRDDALYDFEERKAARTEGERPTIAGGTRAALDHFVGATGDAVPQSDDEQASAMTAEGGDAGSDPRSTPTGAAAPSQARQDGADTETGELPAGAGERTTDRQDKPAPPSEDEGPKPTTPEAYGPWLAAWLAKATTAGGVKARFKAEEEIRLSFREPESTAEQVRSWREAKDARIKELGDK